MWLRLGIASNGFKILSTLFISRTLDECCAIAVRYQSSFDNYHRNEVEQNVMRSDSPQRGQHIFGNFTCFIDPHDDTLRSVLINDWIAGFTLSSLSEQSFRSFLRQQRKLFLSKRFQILNRLSLTVFESEVADWVSMHSKSVNSKHLIITNKNRRFFSLNIFLTDFWNLKKFRSSHELALRFLILISCFCWHSRIDKIFKKFLYGRSSRPYAGS